MSTQIDTALVQAYRSNIDIKFQQSTSRLRQAVRVETQNAEYEYYDRIGPTAAVQVTTRHGDTPLIETPHTRRRVSMNDYDWADLIDNKDKLRMLADPTSAYVANAVMALNRTIDDLILDNALGTAYTGKGGGTSTTYTTATYGVAVDYVESGVAANSNLTIGKLRRARYLLDTNEAANDGENDLFIVVHPSQIQSLLRTTEVTSADYNTVKALVNGEINQFMGFNFIRSARVNTDSNSYRQVIAFERQGLLLAMGSEIMVDVGPRRDKRNSVQVYVSLSAGSTRMWEEKVVEIKCDETV